MKTTVIILLAAIVYLLFEHRQERLHDRQAKERAEIMAEQKKREDAADYMRRKTQDAINQTRLIEAAGRDAR